MDIWYNIYMGNVVTVIFSLAFLGGFGSRLFWDGEETSTLFLPMTRKDFYCLHNIVYFYWVFTIEYYMI